MLENLSPFVRQVASLTTWLVILTVVFVPLERVFALRRPTDRLKDIPKDLGFYFLNSLLPAVLIGIPVSILVTALAKVTPQAYSDAVDSLPLAVKIFLGLVVSEIGAYWAHRWSHQSPFLWRFHSLHHAPEHIDWLVNTHAHPLDMVFTRLCGLLPLYVLGLASHGSGLVPTLVLFFGTIWAFFVHANVRWRFGPLEHLIATPHFHHWHHTNDENRDHNYAALFPWIDRIFGTYHGPKHWPPVYGVDKPPPADFVGALLSPFAPPSREPAAPPAEAAKDA